MKQIVLFILTTFTVLSAQNKQTHNENYFAKYAAITMLAGSNFCEGLDQAWFFNGEKSYWKGYTKGTSHAWYFARRSMQVGSVLMAASWHPKQKLFSKRTFFQYAYITCIQSWTLNRGLRLVQTGELFPHERGHAWYIDFGWIRLSIQSQDWMQWTSLGLGVAGLVAENIWKD